MDSYQHSTPSKIGSREILVVSSASLIFAIYSFLVHPQSPAVTDPNGDWFGWFDQGEYLSIARSLADFSLPLGPENYTYGLGYPLLAVPFIWLGFERDPFIVPDILAASATVVLIYVFATRIASRAAGALAALLLIVATPVIKLAVEPWSSTVSCLCIAAALVVATTPKVLRARHAVLLGALSAWSFSARFVDVVPVMTITLWALFDRAPGGRRIRLIVTAGGVALTGLILVLVSQWVSLGSPFITPYASHLRPDGVNDQSLGQYQLDRVGSHFWQTFVTGIVDGVPTGVSPLLLASPFLVLAPIGFVVLIRQGRDRSLHIALFSVSGVMSILYLSFVAGGGQDLVYRNVRYWLPYFGYWTVLAAIGLYSGYRWMVAESSPRTHVSPSLSTDVMASTQDDADPTVHDTQVSRGRESCRQDRMGESG